MFKQRLVSLETWFPRISAVDSQTLFHLFFWAFISPANGVCYCVRMKDDNHFQISVGWNRAILCSKWCIDFWKPLTYRSDFAYWLGKFGFVWVKPPWVVFTKLWQRRKNISTEPLSGDRAISLCRQKLRVFQEDCWSPKEHFWDRGCKIWLSVASEAARDYVDVQCFLQAALYSGSCFCKARPFTLNCETAVFHRVDNIAYAL